MEEKLNETNVEAARVSPDGGFQLIKVWFIPNRKVYFQMTCQLKSCMLDLHRYTFISFRLIIGIGIGMIIIIIII